MNMFIHIVTILNENREFILTKTFKNFDKAERWAKRKIRNTAWDYQIQTTFK